MSATNGHSLSGAHQRLFELATKAGIRPTYKAIGKAAGLAGTTVSGNFSRPGRFPDRVTFERIAAALRITSTELRAIHAMLQEEVPPPLLVCKTDPAPPPVPEPDPMPRNFMAELCDHCLKSTPVVVATRESNGELALAAGRIVGIHNGWVAIHSRGDSRPARVRIEDVTDVRKAPAFE